MGEITVSSDASYEVYFSGLHPMYYPRTVDVIECARLIPGVSDFLSACCIVGGIAYPFDGETGIFRICFQRSKICFMAG